MADDDEVSLKLTVVWEGRFLGNSSVFGFNRQWLETHTLRELLEHAVADFDNQLIMRADANISIMRATHGRHNRLGRWLAANGLADAHNSDIFICGMQPLDEDHPHHASFVSDYRMTCATPVEIEYYTHKKHPACLAVHPHLMRQVFRLPHHFVIVL
eukprot:jgi/Tetstr1/435104/TSEL_024072.t1